MHGRQIRGQTMHNLSNSSSFVWCWLSTVYLFPKEEMRKSVLLLATFFSKATVLEKPLKMNVQLDSHASIFGKSSRVVKNGVNSVHFKKYYQLKDWKDNLKVHKSSIKGLQRVFKTSVFKSFVKVPYKTDNLSSLKLLFNDVFFNTLW